MSKIESVYDGPTLFFFFSCNCPIGFFVAASECGFRFLESIVSAMNQFKTLSNTELECVKGAQKMPIFFLVHFSPFLNHFIPFSSNWDFNWWRVCWTSFFSAMISTQISLLHSSIHWDFVLHSYKKTKDKSLNWDLTLNDIETINQSKHFLWHASPVAT